MDWQPIETAPTDGTLILVYISGKGIVMAEKNGAWGWRSYPGRYSMAMPPTHWQPLPAPPATRGG